MSTYRDLIKASLNNSLTDDELIQGLIELISANPSIKDEALGAIEAPYRTGRLSETLYEKITAAITDDELLHLTDATRLPGQAADEDSQSDDNLDKTIVQAKDQIQTKNQPHHQTHTPTITPPKDQPDATDHHPQFTAPNHLTDNTPAHNITAANRHPAPHEEAIEEYKAKLQHHTSSEDETFIDVNENAFGNSTGSLSENADTELETNVATDVKTNVVAKPSQSATTPRRPNTASKTIRTAKSKKDTQAQPQASTAIPANPRSLNANEMPTQANAAEATSLTVTQHGSTELSSGSIIKGRFILEEILGQGGMGVVYKARDMRKEEAQDRNPHVAIKVLGASFKDHPHSLIALQREARKAQTLAHPNIVTVYDFDRDGDTVYMTMEYLEGDALDRTLKRLKPNVMEKSKALRIIEGICNGLAYAHKHNIIHSDLKPGNIFVTKNGDVKVFDFGIARAMKPASDAKGDTTVFDAGSLGGLTPAYASLEMLQGEDPDIRDDIYALACIAFELLGGVHPYNKLPADQAKERKLNPPLLKNLSRRQYKALLKGIAFERITRTESVKQFNLDISGQRTLSKPIVGATIASIIAIALLVGPFQQYLNKQKVSELADALKSGDENTINSTLNQLASADSNLRENVLSEAKEELILYYKRLAEQDINTQQNKFNFEQARTTLSLAENLFPDSAQLTSIIETIEDRKNRLLNDLTRTFNAQLEAGTFLPGSPVSGRQQSPPVKKITILDTLKTVAAIDAAHPLLSDPRLIVEFSAKANQAANARQFDTAKALLDAAITQFPNEVQLVDLQDQIRIHEQNYLLGKLTTSPGKIANSATGNSANKDSRLSIADRQKNIERLLNAPFSHSDWSNTLAQELDFLIDKLPATDPWLKNKRNYIAELYFRHAQSRHNAKRYTEADALIQRAHRWDPTIPGIEPELASIAEAKQTFEKQKQQQARDAKIEGLKQTLRTQAKANDVKGAKASYNALRKTLGVNNKYIRVTAPDVIGNAYLRLANDLAKRGQYNSAIKLADAGLSISPDLTPLIAAKKEFITIHSKQNAHKLAIENDPCKPSFAGYGKRSKATCADMVDANQPGPKLVVIPAGKSFKKPFAIGKYEVSVEEFNVYCQRSKSCQKINTSNTTIPVTNISLKQANAFINWLSQTTGYTYRLPTVAEWKYAASANGKQPKKDFNCRVVLGGRVVKGNALVNISTGKKNGWGLTNYIGNAQEWVTTSTNKTSSKLIAIGGAYKDSLANCDITLSREHDGGADTNTGFRLLRELT